MPYREQPQVAVTHLPGDPSSVSKVIQLRDRFRRLDVGKLWPPPADGPFTAHRTTIVGVSGDGRRALICASGYGWLIDTATMVASAPSILPHEPDIVALSHDGSIAVFVAGESLYRWKLGSAPPRIEEVWTSAGLARTDSLRLSADGAIAIATRRRRRATVRVFELDVLTMTHNFEVDADECLLLHPSGRHIVAFGDDGIARFYGEEGKFHEFDDCAGGAFSPDGQQLLVNSFSNRREVLRYRVKVDGSSLLLGSVKDFEVCSQLGLWNWRARFSPSGKRAILDSSASGAILLDLESGASKMTGFDVNWSTAFLADESKILSPGASARALGVRSEGVLLAQLEGRELLGILCASRNETPILAAITATGMYGGLEGDARTLDEEPGFPYERPGLISALLSSGTYNLEREEEQRFEEVLARQHIWQDYRDAMTVDIGSRHLVGVNRGLVELTPEIVHRAGISVARAPRFGKPQLSLLALQKSGDELRALSAFDRDRVFEAMVERMRAAHGGRAGQAKPQYSASELSNAAVAIPPLPSDPDAFDLIEILDDDDL